MIALPRVIGHRGAAALAPENTLAGFRAAHRGGAGWVEFDVRLTADSVPVVIHDPDLRRTAGLPMRVGRTPLARLAAADVGRWFAPGFAGERIPTLAEALAECARLGLGANVELKWCGVRSPALVRAVASALHQAPAMPLLVSSFRPRMLAAFARHAPGVPRGLLMERPRPGWRRAADRLRCASVHVGERGLDDVLLARLKSAGLPLVVYTVNDARRAAGLLAGGADAIITDRPDALVRALG